MAMRARTRNVYGTNKNEKQRVCHEIGRVIKKQKHANNARGLSRILIKRNRVCLYVIRKMSTFVRIRYILKSFHKRLYKKKKNKERKHGIYSASLFIIKIQSRSVVYHSLQCVILKVDDKQGDLSLENTHCFIFLFSSRPFAGSQSEFTGSL